MKLKQFIILLVCCLSVTCKIFCEEIKSPLQIEYSTKELPVYKFNNSEVGRFLDEFCDSCANIDQFQYTVISQANPKFVLQYNNAKVYENYNDYITIFTHWIGQPLFNMSQGIIKTSNGHNCILTDISDDFIQKLQLNKTSGYYEISIGNNNYPFLTGVINIITLFYIPSCDKIDIMTMLVNQQPIQNVDSEIIDCFKKLMD